MLPALHILACTASLVSAQPASVPWSEQPYLGLSVRDGPHGPAVSWIRPGPLGGTGFLSSSGIRRGDNLIAINNAPIPDAAAFDAAIRGAFAAHGFRLARQHRQFVLPIALHKAVGSRTTSERVERVLASAGLLGLAGSPVTVLAER